MADRAHRAASDPILVLITGIMAAGKSTVAQRLAERLPCSVHLRGDLFRRMIVNGQAEMGFDLTPEARAQLDLRYRLAAVSAAMYLDAGFNVVYQDILIGDGLREAVERLRDRRLHVVVLCPGAEIVAARESQRPKTGYGEVPIDPFDRVLREHTPRIGLWLDSSDQTVDQTVDQILDHLDDARITAG